MYATWTIPAPIGGAPPRKLLDEGLLGMRWSPDGKRVVAVSGGGLFGDALILANHDGTNRQELVPIEGGRHLHNLEWSRDGQYVYFIQTYEAWNGEPSQISRVPARGGALEPVVQTLRRALFPAPMPGSRGLIYSANPDSVDSSDSGGGPPWAARQSA